MRRFFAIVGREWRAYFLSPLAYVILAAFLVMNGLIFYAIVSFLNAPNAPNASSPATIGAATSERIPDSRTNLSVAGVWAKAMSFA